MKKALFLSFLIVALSLFAKETTPDFTPQMIGEQSWKVNAKELVGNNKATILLDFSVKEKSTFMNRMLPLMHLRTGSRLTIGFTYYAGGGLQFSFSDRDKTFRHDFKEKIEQGKDYKLGVTWDGSSVRVYYAGAMIASAPQPLPVKAEVRNLNLGPYKDGWINLTPWKDEILINSIRIFDEALPPETIAEMQGASIAPLTETHPNIITIPQLQAGTTAPVIDGKLSEDCWKYAGSMPHLIRGNFPKKSGSLPPHDFKLTYDQDNLYLGVTSIFPGRVPIQEGKPRTPTSEPEPWGFESVEFYIQTEKATYRFAGNVAGGNTEWKNNDAKYFAPWEYKTTKQMNIDDSILWTAEFSIPWKSMELTAPPKEAKINVCRSWKLPECGSHSSLNYTGDVYSGPDGNLVKAVFAKAPSFQMTSKNNPSTGEYVQKFAIATPTRSNLTYDLSMARMDGSAAPMSIYNRTWNLKDGEILTDGATTAITSPDYDALLFTFLQNGKVVMREIVPFELNEEFFGVTPLFLHEKVRADLKQTMLRIKFGADFNGEITLTAPDKSVVKVPADKEVIEIPFKRTNAAGKYVLALVNAADGKVIDSKELNYPGIGEWEHQDFHKDWIIPPFTPMVSTSKANALNTSVCNDRTYTWNNSMFPTQITALKQNLLTKPIELIINGENITTNNFKVVSTQKHRAEFTSAASTANVDIKASAWIEYDGVQLNTLTVTPKKALNGMQLRYTMPANLVKYVHGASGGGWGSKITRPVSNNMKVGSYPSFWLGNEELGLCFFVESRESWTAREQNAYNIDIQGNEAVITVNIMDKIAANKPINLEFGLLATPVRPRSIKYPFDTLSWSYVNPMNRKGRRPLSDVSDMSCFSGGDLGSFFGDIDDTEGHKTEAKLQRELKELAEGFNVRPIPYTCSRHLSIKYPETAAFISEWTFKPMSEMDYTHTGHFVYDCCPTTSANDFFIWKYKQMLKHFPGIKGIYFDFGGVNECSNEIHGCKGRTPMLAQREFYRRIAIAQLEAGIKDPVTVIHNTDKVQIPAFTFTTHLLNGEQVRQASTTLLHNKKDILDSWGIDVFASELSTLPWGITNSVYMPFDRLSEKNGGDEKDAPYKFRMGKAAFAATLIHNTIPSMWRNHLGLFDKLIRVYDKFGVDKGEFVGYWHQPATVKGANDIYVSCFVSPDKKKLLAVIGHVGKPHVNQDFDITFDLAKLGIKNKLATATDTMTAPDPEYEELFKLQKQYNVPPVRGPILLDNCNFGSKVNAFDGKTLKMHLDFHSFAIVEIK